MHLELNIIISLSKPMLTKTHQLLHQFITKNRNIFFVIKYRKPRF